MFLATLQTSLFSPWSFVLLSTNLRKKYLGLLASKCSAIASCSFFQEKSCWLHLKTRLMRVLGPKQWSCSLWNRNNDLKDYKNWELQSWVNLWVCWLTYRAVKICAALLGLGPQKWHLNDPADFAQFKKNKCTQINYLSHVWVEMLKWIMGSQSCWTGCDIVGRLFQRLW